jgi:deoxyribodipyrimidine photolyase-related protein
MTAFERIILVAFDQLNFDHGAMANANPQTDLVVLVESQRMLANRNWHTERLFFMVSSARHFAQEVRNRGFTVDYRQAATTADGLQAVWVDHGHLPTIAAQPASYQQARQFERLGIDTVESDFFLTSRASFASWAEAQKTFVMENFYRLQRVRLNLLVEGAKPLGGRWNFDEDNRLPPPKTYVWPPRLTHTRDAIDKDVAKQLGHQITETWATTRAGALQALEHFIEHNLAGFGPLEDASTNDDWSLHHSLLSPYLNVGLLHPGEVVDAAVAEFDKGLAPIQSVEAFVRQIIGWREYINGMYWFLGEDYAQGNGLAANRKLLPLFNDSTKTKMNCVGSVVSDVEKRAWVHHIPRLMILSNLALLTSTNPQQFLDWMRENFIDASQWVMVPNVIGMGVHADGGRLMTKPYAAGGAYINRMTQYCKGCVYDPKLRVGDNACPFTTLYWDFLDRHRETFAKNHRMGQQLMGLNRLSDLPDLRVRALEVLEGLDSGSI